MGRVRVKWWAGMATAGATLLVASPARAQLTAELETGRAWSGYNDVRIPGSSAGGPAGSEPAGTLFSLSRELSAEPAAFVRVRLSYAWGGRHLVSVLAAPLRLEATGRLDRPLRFTDVVFPAAVPLQARYRFDSYRLTYRYGLVRTPRLELGLGGTLKLRAAEIAVSGGGLRASKTNVGPVPLVNFAARWRAAGRAGLELSGDALAAPQGRAEDVALGAFLEPTSRLSVRLGYRLLEGGADVAEVYNFALIHYAYVGAAVRL